MYASCFVIGPNIYGQVHNDDLLKLPPSDPYYLSLVIAISNINK
jgi:hypothetical protein